MRGPENYNTWNSGKTEPVWKRPESDLFLQWYLDQSEKSEEFRAPEFQTFLQEVEAGTAQLPTIEQVARQKIEALRAKNSIR